LLAVAVAVEKQSDHPLASAIVEGVGARRPGLAAMEASGVEAVIGYGSSRDRGRRRGHDRQARPVHARRALPQSVADAVSKLQGEGRTVMVVRLGGRFLGVLGVMDTPRESARAVVAALHALGIEQTIMLTGDNQRVADAVAKHVGIRVARGDLLPEQKVAAIAELARSTEPRRDGG
jgi:Cd2+/Zn2+-exporting ATPase